MLIFVGLIGLTMLPVEQFPDMAPPTISVEASYSGANAIAVQRSVIVPIEEAVNGVEGMMYMTSSASSTGSANVTITFRQGTDPDMAMVNVQNRVAEIQSQLPAEVTKSGVTVRERSSSNIKMLALASPNGTYDDEFITNYMKINLEPRLSRVEGVGSVDVMGPDYALRIWLDPQKMAQFGLIPSDISTVLDQQNLETSTGTLGYNAESAFQYDMLYKGRLENEVDYENLIVRSLPDGGVLYLKDVAEIELGLRDYNIFSNVDGGNGRTLRISQTAGSNANAVIEGVDAVVAEINAELPEDLVLVDMMNTKDFLDASIRKVVITLLQAILLVALVVYIFLQSFRSTLIPVASIVVSLIGTFAFLYAIGFSINLLTLFALVLVIGTVVDDAIVVVEAVQSKFDLGYKSPYLATIDAMGDITSALVTTTVVFMAVFIPVCFTSGTAGTFYTQFGITMAIAVGLSTLNALTLSPALCALIMTPHSQVAEGEKMSFSSRFHVAFDASFSRIVTKYKKQASFFLKYRGIAVLLVLVACGGLYYMLNNTRTGVVPSEDTGSVYISVQTSPGYSYNETRKIMAEVEERIKDLEEIEAYSNITGVSFMGSSGATGGQFVLRLKDWSERPGEHQSANALSRRIYELTSDITAANIMVFTPPMITGYGMSDGFSLYIQDRNGVTTEELAERTYAFIDALSQREEIARVQTGFSADYPQYLLDVDAAQCVRNGVAPNDVLSVIAGYVGSSYASNLNKFSKLYRVVLQAGVEDRVSIEDLDNMYVRNSDGEMSPVTQYLSIERTYGPQSLSRFNMFPSISVSGMPADGYSSGQAIEAIREVAEQTLPVGYGFEFGGLTREESSSGASTVIIFAICIAFVYLILCALYESIFIPLAVILSVPFGLLGSFIFAHLFGLTNDIYMQTGLLMLIGLLAKTAILLTEYASERRKMGESILQAAISAAQVRLRPILMTSMTLIIGMLPLMFASGVGANGNISLGVGVVGGMLIGTIALIFVVPALFVIFQSIQERVMPTRVLPSLDEKRF